MGIHDSADRNLEEALGLPVHQNDVGLLVRNENRVADVLENQVEPVLLATGLQLSLTDAFELMLELGRRALQVGYIPKDRQIRDLSRYCRRQGSEQDFEKKIATLERIDQIQ